jgi:hypothetical protein
LNWQLVVRNSENRGNEELLQGIALHVEGADVLMLDDEWLRLATAQGEYTIPLLQVSGVEESEIPSPTLADKQVTAPFVPSSSNPPANHQNAHFFDLFWAALDVEMESGAALSLSKGASDEPDEQVRARGAEMKAAQSLLSLPEVRLAASDGTEADYFGYSVSVDGDRPLVGAYGSDANGSASGAAYIFHWDGTSWLAEGKLLPSDGAAGDSFGLSVSLNGDRLLVGAPFDDDNGLSSGAAYLFRWHDLA